MAKLFTIPTVQEIYDFIIYKQPSWPGSFIEWYAEKFFNHYQASGWRLSSNILMKDWKAAFCSNWKELKWDAALKLAEIERQERGLSYLYNEDGTENNLGTLFDNFKNGKIDRKGMARWYKPLRENRLINFTKEETEKLVADAGNDKEYGRYLSVKLYFTKLINLENDNKRSHDVLGAQTD